MTGVTGSVIQWNLAVRKISSFQMTVMLFVRQKYSEFPHIAKWAGVIITVLSENILLLKIYLIRLFLHFSTFLPFVDFIPFSAGEKKRNFALFLSVEVLYNTDVPVPLDTGVRGGPPCRDLAGTWVHRGTSVPCKCYPELNAGDYTNYTSLPLSKIAARRPHESTLLI